MTFIIAQGLGIVATLCFLFSFQVRTNRGLYLLQAGGCLAFAAQFLILGALGGCVTQLFIIARNMMLTMYNRWAWVRWKGWVPIFLAIANEVVVIGSVLLSIYRYGMKELLDPESEFQKGGSK